MFLNCISLGLQVVLYKIFSEGKGCANMLVNHGHQIIDTVWWDFFPVLSVMTFLGTVIGYLIFVFRNFVLSSFAFLLAFSYRFWFGPLLYIFFPYL